MLVVFLHVFIYIYIYIIYKWSFVYSKYLQRRQFFPYQHRSVWRTKRRLRKLIFDRQPRCFPLPLQIRSSIDVKTWAVVFRCVSEVRSLPCSLRWKSSLTPENRRQKGKLLCKNSLLKRETAKLSTTNSSDSCQWLRVLPSFCVEVDSLLVDNYHIWSYLRCVDSGKWCFLQTKMAEGTWQRNLANFNTRT